MRSKSEKKQFDLLSALKGGKDQIAHKKEVKKKSFFGFGFVLNITKG